VGNGTFRPGDDPRRHTAGRSGPNRRTREIEELSREIIERRGGVEGLLSRFFSDDVDPKLYLDAVKLVLGYAYGLPRQRIAVTGDQPLAIVIRRAGAGRDAPEASPVAGADSGRPGEVPCDLGGPEVGEDADGV
jgi:hypothetical protein